MHERSVAGLQNTVKKNNVYVSWISFSKECFGPSFVKRIPQFFAVAALKQSIDRLLAVRNVSSFAEILTLLCLQLITRRRGSQSGKNKTR